MTEKAQKEGVAAFARGDLRASNPYDAGAEDWMCWRDGWEQAKAVSERPGIDPSLGERATVAVAGPEAEPRIGA